MAKIFISYSRSDSNLVDQLIGRLHSSGNQVWIDRQGIRGGEQWRQQIVEAIEKSDVFLLVLSKNSILSDNVRTEVDLAKESKKKIIPIDLHSLDIPPSMKYQLVGLQRINMYSDYEYGYQELLEALGEAQLSETAAPKQGASVFLRERQRTGKNVVLIGGMAALIVLIAVVGYSLGGNFLRTEAVNHPTPPPEFTQTSLEELRTVADLEPLLLQANIRLSEPGDEERTRSYFWGPESAYHKLAVASLTVVGDRRFIQHLNLDIIDKHYTLAVGSGYAERGPLDLEILKRAMIDAHLDYWGYDVATVDDLLEPLD